MMILNQIKINLMMMMMTKLKELLIIKKKKKKKWWFSLKVSDTQQMKIYEKLIDDKS